MTREPRAESYGPGVGEVAERVRAVQGVVQRAPSRVGGVDRVAGVGHRHDQLRAGDLW